MGATKTACVMQNDLLERLLGELSDEIDGIARTPAGLEAIVDARYGELPLLVEHDAEAESVRVSVTLPPPAGAGIELLLWCLHLNSQYWDVKVGLDDEGRLLVHADLDVSLELPDDELAAMVSDRAETVVDLVDDDLLSWVLAHDLGTPAQRQRWLAPSEEPDEED